jgi:hypothetical protein
LYWEIYAENNDYESFYSWLYQNGKKPGFGKATDYIFNQLPEKEILNPQRLHLLKKTLKKLYGIFCSYNHTPKMQESTVTRSGFTNISLEDFFYAFIHFNQLLRQICYLYTVTYPISLFPVEIHKKFGFTNGPIGVFFDYCNFKILEKYLGESNLRQLKIGFSDSVRITNTLEMFDNQPSLTDRELESDWKRHLSQSKTEAKAEFLPQRLALKKAQDRSLKWALNYIATQEKFEVPEKIAAHLNHKLRNW